MRPSIHTVRRQVDDLIHLLASAHAQYVRCIKTNHAKASILAPEGIDRDLILTQVKYLGLSENVAVRKAGYCHHAKHEAFLDRYRIICRHTWPPPPSGSVAQSSQQRKADIQAILASGDPVMDVRVSEAAPAQLVEEDVATATAAAPTTSSWPPVPQVTLEDGEDFKIGTTRVFIKHPSGLFQLEAARRAALNPTACQIQTRWRCFIAVLTLKRQKAAMISIQTNCRVKIATRNFKKTMGLMVKTQVWIRRFVDSCKYRALVKRCRSKKTGLVVPPWMWARDIERIARGNGARAALDPEVCAFACPMSSSLVCHCLQSLIMSVL